MKSCINAPSLRSEVDAQTRQGRVELMLSPMSTTTEHYDLFAADSEEETRQVNVQRTEREKVKEKLENGLSARIIRP
eukprot:12316530-Heterocapsa_arctica.AAC.1